MSRSWLTSLVALVQRNYVNWHLNWRKKQHSCLQQLERQGFSRVLRKLHDSLGQHTQTYIV